MLELIKFQFIVNFLTIFRIFFQVLLGKFYENEFNWNKSDANKIIKIPKKSGKFI